MSIKVGDMVVITKDKKLVDGKLICTTGTKYIVNEVKTMLCKCPSSNFTYIWVGNYYETPVHNTCSKCQNVNIVDNKVWMTDTYFDKLDANKEFSTKYGMQIQLMRLLIAKDITPEAYRKLMSMTEGDNELLELGTQIMNKLATNELL